MQFAQTALLTGCKSLSNRFVRRLCLHLKCQSLGAHAFDALESVINKHRIAQRFRFAIVHILHVRNGRLLVQVVIVAGLLNDQHQRRTDQIFDRFDRVAGALQQRHDVRRVRREDGEKREERREYDQTAGDCRKLEVGALLANGAPDKRSGIMKSEFAMEQRMQCLGDDDSENNYYQCDATNPDGAVQRQNEDVLDG